MVWVSTPQMMPSGLVTIYKVTGLPENFLFEKSLKEGKEPFEKPKLLFSETKHLIIHLDGDEKYQLICLNSLFNK